MKLRCGSVSLTICNTSFRAVAAATAEIRLGRSGRRGIVRPRVGSLCSAPELGIEAAERFLAARDDIPHGAERYSGGGRSFLALN